MVPQAGVNLVGEGGEAREDNCVCANDTNVLCQGFLVEPSKNRSVRGGRVEVKRKRVGRLCEGAMVQGASSIKRAGPSSAKIGIKDSNRPPVVSTTMGKSYECDMVAVLCTQCLAQASLWRASYWQVKMLFGQQQDHASIALRYWGCRRQGQWRSSASLTSS